MKRIINYIATHYIDLIAYCALFDAITAPFLLHLDVNTYNSLYTIWLVLQIPFIIFTSIKIYKSRN